MFGADVDDDRGLAAWYDLCILQAITHEGDMGDRSREYGWGSAWARGGD